MTERRNEALGIALVLAASAIVWGAALFCVFTVFR